MVIKEICELNKIKRLNDKDLESIDVGEKENLLKATYSYLDRANTIKNKTLCEFFIGLIILIIGIIFYPMSIITKANGEQYFNSSSLEAIIFYLGIIIGTLLIIISIIYLIIYIYLYLKINKNKVNLLK